MRIYLDNNVFQDLKKNEYSTLLNLIIQDSYINIYCFSEAHLYDLSRDTSEWKIKDMHFMERIVQNHCYFFDEKVRFEYNTPFEYYDSFDWTPTLLADNLFSDENEYAAIFKSFLQAHPIDLSNTLDSNSLPDDFPIELIDIIMKPKNSYDFFEMFYNLTIQLSNEQKKFKELLKYLHKSSLLAKIYKSLGIEGFDGEKIIDRQKLLNSYIKFFIKEGQKKNIYDAYMEMYNGLEFLGFVKGIPKKQKMMNLINDARHSFFAGCCDVVVSKDEDFLKKSKFMYDLFEVNTLILNYSNYEEQLYKMTRDRELTLKNLFKELSENISDDNFLGNEIVEESNIAYYRSSKTYFTYFNLIGIVSNNSNGYVFLSKSPNLSSGVFIKEIKYVTDRLYSEIGPDINDFSIFDSSEIIDGKWNGRKWKLGDTMLELNYQGRLYLNVFKTLPKYE